MSATLVKFCVQGVDFTLDDPEGAVAAETTEGFDYEPAATAVMLRLLGEGRRRFLDVGAHYGYFSVLVARANPSCEVHAFEPGPDHLPTLRRNVELNDLAGRVTVHALALSDERGSIAFSGRTLKVEEGAAADTVEAIPFDDLNGEGALACDLAKIDVHGAEGKVLIGMKESLRRREVKNLLIEVHAAHLLAAYDYGTLVDLLRSTGYQLFEMDGFRDASEPRMVPLEGEALEALVDYGRWTEDQIGRERMLFASLEADRLGLAGDA